MSAAIFSESYQSIFLEFGMLLNIVDLMNLTVT